MDSTAQLQSLQTQIDSLNESVKTKVATPPNIRVTPDPTYLPQGNGSNLNADKVDGINASYKPMPNTLIPLGKNGQFPVGVIPTSGGGGSGFLLGNGAPTDKHILIADGSLWQSRAASGDVTITADTGTFTLANSGVTAATYGDSTHYPIIVVDAKGRITSASNQSVASSSPGGSNGDIQFNNSSAFGGTNDLFWDNTNKRLGIGTATPSFRIDVEVSTAATIAVFNTTTGAGSSTNSALLYATADSDEAVNGYIKPLHSGTGYLGTTSFGTSYVPIIIDSGQNGQTGTPASYIAFKTAAISAASTEKVRIDSAGLVGIGTASPNKTLDVIGDIRYSASLFVAGDTTGGGTVVGLGTNCPASTLTAPYTWVKVISSDGSTVYMPAYK